MRALFVSYDGALDPLGASQVLPYLRGLASRGVALTLVSFEKPAASAEARRREELAAALARAGIRWRPLRYHKRPRLAASAWDLLRGAGTIRGLRRAAGAALVHCRGDVAMAMARLARLQPGVRLLYDMRGFFAEERVESGSWRGGGATDRLVRRVARGNLLAADGLVVLTAAAREILAARQAALPPLAVIPTCADLTLFHPRPPDTGPDFGLAYAGQLGTWYMAAEMAAFAQVAAARVPGRVLWLSPQLEEAARAGVSPDWATLASVPQAEVAAWLRRARAAFFFIRPTPAKRASCPTKLAEALGCGLPILCNAGIGDLDAILERERVGVIVEGFSTRDYERAAQRLAALLADPATPRRCRSLAEARFGVERGVAEYHRLYEELAG